MPNIIIREIDNTTAGSSAYSNFSVAMAGPGTATPTNGFDQNGILERSDVKAFKTALGASYDTTDINIQMAQQLLGMGYTILYKAVGSEDVTEYDFWEAFQDKANYDFRYILEYVPSGSEDVSAIQSAISKLAFTRRDCIAICDVPSELYMGKTTSEAMSSIKTGFSASAPAASELTNQPESVTGESENGVDNLKKYVAYFMPQVTYTAASLGLDKTDKTTNRTFPAGFHYLACAKKAFSSFAEWYAVAGYTRGISNYQIEALSAKFGDAAINTLQPRTATGSFSTAINIITSVKNNKYLWGNRTAYALDDTGLVAGHFLNIRQLCCTIKKEIYQACRKLTFDPNSDLLWLNFKGMVEPLLDRMQNDQGINGYELTKYTPEDAEKGKLYIRLRISPIEAVEDFDITIMLEDSNVELGE